MSSNFSKKCLTHTHTENSNRRTLPFNNRSVDNYAKGALQSMPKMRDVLLFWPTNKNKEGLPQKQRLPYQNMTMT